MGEEEEREGKEEKAEKGERRSAAWRWRFALGKRHIGKARWFWDWISDLATLEGPFVICRWPVLPYFCG
jgi:hypothetical protein